MRKIFFDVNNLALRLIHLPMIQAQTNNPKFDFWKYLIFRNIYDYIVFETSSEDEEGVTAEVLLVCDSKEKTWRHEIYPPYKGNRKKDQTINWEEVFTELEMFMNDLAAYTPWKVLRVPGAESDDIIATIVENTEDECVIHSSDQDFLQLESDRVVIFAPHKDDYVSSPFTVKIGGANVTCNSAEDFLAYAVLTGQGRKDNVYNVKTPTNWDEEKRKPGFGVKAAQKVLKDGLEESLEKMGCLDNYNRNLRLISFDYIPESVRNTILEAYNAYPVNEIVRVKEMVDRYPWPSLQAEGEDIEETIAFIAGHDIDSSEILTASFEEEDDEVEDSGIGFVL